MSNLKLTNLKIELPKDFNGSSPTSSQILSWLEFELGISPQMSMENPLVYTDLKDCKVSFDKSFLDGIEVVL